MVAGTSRVRTRAASTVMAVIMPTPIILAKVTWPVVKAATTTVLTGREREVLALVGRGLSNDQIAAELTLSPATARTHVSRAMTRLGARDRAQLVVAAYQTGLVHPDPGA
jgi:DNA-binding NarL/FixJ family response regulator